METAVLYGRPRYGETRCPELRDAARGRRDVARCRHKSSHQPKATPRQTTRVFFCLHRGRSRRNANASPGTRKFFENQAMTEPALSVSTPRSSTRYRRGSGGISSAAERQPAKLETRVRLPYAAPQAAVRRPRKPPKLPSGDRHPGGLPLPVLSASVGRDGAEEVWCSQSHSWLKPSRFRCDSGGLHHLFQSEGPSYKRSMLPPQGRDPGANPGGSTSSRRPAGRGAKSSSPVRVMHGVSGCESRRLAQNARGAAGEMGTRPSATRSRVGSIPTRPSISRVQSPESRARQDAGVGQQETAALVKRRRRCESAHRLHCGVV